MGNVHGQCPWAMTTGSADGHWPWAMHLDIAHGHCPGPAPALAVCRAPAAPALALAPAQAGLGLVHKSNHNFDPFLAGTGPRECSRWTRLFSECGFLGFSSRFVHWKAGL